MKKGFTLIELLAVIVILAVVSLIAIPLILNVIETSKKGAIKDSAYGIIEAADMYLAKNMKDGIASTMAFTCSKNKCVSDSNVEITFKGKVESGTLLLTPSGKTVVCVDDGENYALKLEDSETINNGDGTCGAYEETNGQFTILSDVDTLNKQIASLRVQISDSYQDGFEKGYQEGFEAGKLEGGDYYKPVTGKNIANLSVRLGDTNTGVNSDIYLTTKLKRIDFSLSASAPSTACHYARNGQDVVGEYHSGSASISGYVMGITSEGVETQLYSCGAGNNSFVISNEIKSTYESLYVKINTSSSYSRPNHSVYESYSNGYASGSATLYFD